MISMTEPIPAHGAGYDLATTPPAGTHEGASAPSPGGRPAGAAGPRPRVFVVEDDLHDREIYGCILCYNGYDVMFAGSGAAALGMASRYEADAVLLDLGLPDVDGLQVLAELRQRPGYGATPVIALSGFTRQRRGAEALRAGCAEYIEKPARPVAVLHAIEDLIGRAPLPGVGTPPNMFEQPD